MRRAGHKRPASARAIPATPSVTALNAVAFAEEPADHDLLTPIDAVSSVTSEARDDRDIRRRSLEIAIHQRIESRLIGRVRNLHVRAFEGIVVLEGECATFYTKQLAQHAAMGILEDEHLVNSIQVRVQ
jgi:osmotically-inducible protein OsmY